MPWAFASPKCVGQRCANLTSHGPRPKGDGLSRSPLCVKGDRCTTVAPAEGAFLTTPRKAGRTVAFQTANCRAGAGCHSPPVDWQSGRRRQSRHCGFPVKQSSSKKAASNRRKLLNIRSCVAHPLARVRARAQPGTLVGRTVVLRGADPGTALG